MLGMSQNEMFWSCGNHKKENEMDKRVDDIIIRDAKVRYRNFSGKGDNYTPAGIRTFTVFLDDDLGNTLRDEGWNVKWKISKKRPDDPPQAQLKVTVSYRQTPPNIVTITGRGRRDLNEDTVKSLDFADVKQWNLVITPSYWKVNDKRGIKAYLKSLVAWQREDELEADYKDVPYIDKSSEDGDD